MSALAPRAASPRRGIDPYHVQFARARRPRASWQNLGAMLGVNSEDLRAACEGTTIMRQSAPEEPAATAKPLPKRAAERQRPTRYYSPRVGAGTLEAQVLCALSKGPGVAADVVIEATGLTRRQVSTLIGVLRAKKLVTGEQGAGGWWLTPKGVAMQAELEAARG